MDKLPTTEIVGIGAIALGYGVLIWRMWKNQSDLTGRVIDVVEKNADAMNSLKQSVRENTEFTKTTNDTLAQLLVNGFSQPVRKRKKS